MAIEPRGPSAGAPALLVIATGAFVAVALGVYGRQHVPTGAEITTLGFGSMIAMKVWLGVVAGILAVLQLIGALWMYGRLGRPAPRVVGLLHRVSGFAAVLVSLPVAYHCLWSLGFQGADTRVLVHSVFGCLFYGVFVAKVMTLHFTSGPGWLLPAVGSTLLVSLLVVVLTSSLWYLTEVGLTSSGY